MGRKTKAKASLDKAIEKHADEIVEFTLISDEMLNMVSMQATIVQYVWNEKAQQRCRQQHNNQHPLPAIAVFFLLLALFALRRICGASVFVVSHRLFIIC